jgi:hypothetical protein
MVGVSEVRGSASSFRRRYTGKCPGKGKHPKPTKHEKKKIFGLVRMVTRYYAETGTASQCSEYIGPANKFLVKIAVLLHEDHVININEFPVYWNFQVGFYGAGLEKIGTAARK